MIGEETHTHTHTHVCAAEKEREREMIKVIQSAAAFKPTHIDSLWNLFERFTLRLP